MSAVLVRRIVRSLLFASLVLFGSHESHARRSAIFLEYQAPEACGSRAEILEKVDAALGEESSGEGWNAVIRVEKRKDTGFNLYFSALKDEVKSERQLKVDTCQSVVEASTLLLLLTVDPHFRDASPTVVPGRHEPHKSHSLGEKNDNGKSLSPPGAQKIRGGDRSLSTNEQAEKYKFDSTETRSRLNRSLSLSLFALVNAGEGVSAAPGGRVEMSARWGMLVVALGGSWLGKANAPIEEFSGVKVSSHGWGAQILAMARIGKAGFTYGPYAGADLHWLEARVTGISNPSGPDAIMWSGLRAGGRAGIELRDSFHLVFDLGALVPLQRPSFGVDGIGVVHEPNVVGLEGSLGVSWKFFSQ